MEKEKMLHSLRIMFRIWLVSCIFFYGVSNCYLIYHYYLYRSMPIEILSGYPLVSLIVIVLYFIPLLSIIHHYSKRLGVKKYIRISLLFLIFYTLWSSGMIILLIRELLK